MIFETLWKTTFFILYYVIVRIGSQVKHTTIKITRLSGCLRICVSQYIATVGKNYHIVDQLSGSVKNTVVFWKLHL